jgi:single-strand DNA-binding protein
MASLNKTYLMGNLTRDPDVRYTAQGTAVAKMGIAVNRTYKGADGEKKEEVSFFNIVVWGKSAENCGKYLTKGRPILVEGRLQNNTWEKDGQKHTSTEVVADMVHFLGSGQGGAKPAGQAGGEDKAPDFGPPEDGGGDVPY